jgi:lipocalin
VTGSYTIAAQDADYTYTLDTIKVKYRLQNDPMWVAVTAEIDQTNKTWAKTISGLATGTYEVHAVLHVKKTMRFSPYTVWDLEYPTETRTVVVP